MLAIDGRPGYNTRDRQRVGERLGIHWVDIADPDRPHTDATVRDASGVRQQGLDAGGAIFARLKARGLATDGGHHGNQRRKRPGWDKSGKSSRRRRRCA